MQAVIPFYVLTGAPGTGKSALLELLRRQSLDCVDEPARQILAEQRSFGGNGLPDRDPALFVELMLSRAVFERRKPRPADRPVFFDRGLPDLIAYALLYGLDDAPTRNAAHKYRYNPTVFFAPPWQDIYSQDEERRMTYGQACDFGERMRAAYQGLGYTLLELPRESPEDRTQFILDTVAASGTPEAR